MCGICGIVNYGDKSPVDPSQVKAMADRLVHRGPDGDGLWMGAHAGLGHRRLAIIDLEAGSQPMSNETGDVWVCCNGEIYNHVELRSRLEAKGHQFRTRCDTEAIVHLYEEEGLSFVRSLQGMFAIAIWDQRQRKLILARDRLGIKPLVYYDSGNFFAFASELTALLAHAEIPRNIDSAALHLYLNHEFVPAPRTILQGVKKLLPAELLTISEDGDIQRESYWQLSYEPKTALSEADAGEQLWELLSRAVRRRLMSDVPLGAFLSGGIDSSTIVAIMAELCPERVKTFSVGFEDSTYNELDYARRVATQFGTDHHEAILQPDASSVVDAVLPFFDEPLADMSMAATHLVSSVARRHVTVCLSGDGADELFAGYERHLASRMARGPYRWIPPVVRRALLNSFVKRLPIGQGKKSTSDLVRRFLLGANKDQRGRQLRWQTFLDASWQGHVYTPEMREQAAILDEFEAVAAAERRAIATKNLDIELAIETQLYLPDDILAKVDRMSMAVSLEVRVPFLDHEVVEFVAQLPTKFKLRGLRGKHLLRKIMKARLPNGITRRRKQGFSIPIKRWLRNELYDRVAETLAANYADVEGHLQPAAIRRMLDDHRDGRADYAHPLWSMFVLATWFDRIQSATEYRSIPC